MLGVWGTQHTKPMGGRALPVLLQVRSKGQPPCSTVPSALAIELQGESPVMGQHGLCCACPSEVSNSYFCPGFSLWGSADLGHPGLTPRAVQGSECQTGQAPACTWLSNPAPADSAELPTCVHKDSSSPFPEQERWRAQEVGTWHPWRTLSGLCGPPARSHKTACECPYSTALGTWVTVSWSRGPGSLQR